MPKKILLADDSITIQKVVELTFSDGDYEVTAVNNGAKAVQKLAEMRPDIILSDIIMPEKNGYEVCEYVKSHPDFRNIPVVLLTGTFEPFDPDRAEKAGCDAVVTKPFESQSLIHKVEELIAAAQSAAAPAAAPEPESAASPWMDETPTAQPSAFSTGDAFTHESDIFGAAPAPQATTEMPFELPSTDFSGETRAFPRMSFDELSSAASASAAPEPPPAAPAAPEPSPWETPAEPYAAEPAAFAPAGSFDHFGAPAAEPEPESPFGAPPPADEFSGETRAFPRMSFDELQQMANASQAPAPEAAPEPEPSPWNEPAAGSPFGSAAAVESAASPFESAPPAFDSAPSPFADDDAPAFGGETRAFPKMSFDDLQQMAASTPPPAAEQEPAPWGEPADDAPAFGETRAFPKLSFDDFGSPAASEPERAAETAPEPPAAFPSVVPDFSSPAAPAPADFSSAGSDFSAQSGDFSIPANDFSTSSEAEPEPSPWSEPAEASSPFAAPAGDMPEPVESLWSPTADTSAIDTPAAESFSTAAAAPFAEPSSPFNEPMPEDLPFSTETTSAPDPVPATEPSWSPVAAAEAASELDEPAVPPPALAPDAPPMAIAARGSDLSDEQIDRIARRVVELMSDQLVRNIAWEVIPDLAEMVVKERIRQLEAEA